MNILPNYTNHRTTILMYHAFAQAHEAASRYVVSARDFAWQMAWLHRRRYHVINLDTYLRCRREQHLPPSRSVIVTMDDGYADNYSVAHPILRQYGFSATIFLVSKFIGLRDTWLSTPPHTQNNRPLLTQAHIHQMSAEGICFGAHTRTHRPLTALSEIEVTDEIAGSRADLEHQLGMPFLTFAYPYGQNNEMIQRVAAQAGFLGACGTQQGFNQATTPLYNLRRIEVRGDHSRWRFVLALWLGRARLPKRG
jgi:peptidoglycan/xylan/chitin deacetylase (PgdA/CDA1 family)